MKKISAILGKAYYSESPKDVKYMEKCLIEIDEKGMITSVTQGNDPRFGAVCEKYMGSKALKTLGENEVLIPGFIDTHLHAPQWAQSGTALDTPLEIWLGEYTFPLEAKFCDLEFAEKVYRSVIETTLKHGTTTVLYFATLDKEPSLLLCDLCGEMGQRALVGTVSMDDHNSNPEFCCDESAEISVADTEEFIIKARELAKKYHQGIFPVVTPRFIPSCTTEALKALGELAAKYDCHIQTHCSESDWEHGYSKEKYNLNDAVALDSFGLITRKTVLAHAPHLESGDRELIAKKGASIAHCPLSNAYFANGVLPFKKFSDENVNIALATDVSGGYSPSMYSAIRQAVISSRMLNDGVSPFVATENRGEKNSSIGVNEALYSATVAGGIALDLPLGKFEKGYFFDAQVINTDTNIPKFYAEKNELDLLHKIILLSESENIKEVYVQGQKVKG